MNKRKSLGDNIITILKRHKRWLSKDEIRDKLEYQLDDKRTSHAVSSALLNLYDRWELIERTIIKNKSYWKFKRRVKVLG